MERGRIILAFVGIGLSLIGSVCSIYVLICRFVEMH
jgi:hypothetical protein